MSTQISDGIGLVKLFHEQPNWIKESILTSVRSGSDIPVQMLNTIMNGYSKNVRRFKSHIAKELPYLVPVGNYTEENTATGAQIDIITSQYITPIMERQIGLQQAAYDELVVLLGPTHVETLAMLDVLNTFLKFRTDPTITVTYYQITTGGPGNYKNIMDWIMRRHEGMFNVSTADSFFTNSPSLKEEFASFNSDGEGGESRDISYRHQQEDNPGGWAPRSFVYNAAGDQIHEHGGHGEFIDGKQPNQNPYNFVYGYGGSDYYDWPSVTRLDTYQIEFYVNVLGPDVRLWYYPFVRDVVEVEPPPDSSPLSEQLPIVPLRREKRNVADFEDPHQYNESKRALKYLVIDMDELMEQLEQAIDEADESTMDDVDDAYVAFLANLATHDEKVIAYLINFFNTLRFGLTWGDYDPDIDYPRTPALAAEDTSYEGHIERNGYIENVQVAEYRGFKYITLTADRGFQSTLRLKFVYSVVIQGVVGTIGQYQSRVDKGNQDEDEPYNFREAQFIEYTYQRTATEYLLVRMYIPNITFVNWWSGGNSNRKEEVTLSSDTFDMLCVPMNFFISRTYNGLVEAYLYTETVSLFINTVHEEKIPRWKEVLQNLIQVVVFIVAIFIPVILIVNIVVGLVTAIISSIITITGNSEAGQLKANAGVAIGIGAVAFIVSGNITSLVDAIFYLLESIVAIVNAVRSITAIEITEELTSLEEKQAEEQRKFDAANSEFSSVEERINVPFTQLLQTYDNISTYVTEATKTNRAQDMYNMIEYSVDRALRLPEYIYDNKRVEMRKPYL